MPTILAILTAAIIAISGYVAYKTKNKYDEKLTEVDVVKMDLSKSEKSLKEKQGQLESLPAQVSEIQSQSETLVNQESAVSKANEELKAKADELMAKSAANKAKLDEMKEKVTGSTGGAQELAAKMRTVGTEREEMKQAVASQEAIVANRTAEAAQLDARVAEAKTSIEKYNTGESLPSVSARISNIYSEYGFVTLTSGNSDGVITNSTLNVVRDGDVIAKLLVTAVEASRSSASIVPGSIADGVTLSVGDRVVPGQKETAGKLMKKTEAPAVKP